MFAQVSADPKLRLCFGCVAVEHTHREALSECCRLIVLLWMPESKPET